MERPSRMVWFSLNSIRQNMIVPQSLSIITNEVLIQRERNLYDIFHCQVYGGHTERVNFLKGSARVVTYAIIRYSKCFKFHKKYFYLACLLPEMSPRYR